MTPSSTEEIEALRLEDIAEALFAAYSEPHSLPEVDGSDVLRWNKLTELERMKWRAAALKAVELL